MHCIKSHAKEMKEKKRLRETRLFGLSSSLLKENILQSGYESFWGETSSTPFLFSIRKLANIIRNCVFEIVVTI